MNSIQIGKAQLELVRFVLFSEHDLRVYQGVLAEIAARGSFLNDG